MAVWASVRASYKWADMTPPIAVQVRAPVRIRLDMDVTNTYDMYRDVNKVRVGSPSLLDASVRVCVCVCVSVCLWVGCLRVFVSVCVCDCACLIECVCLYVRLRV